MTEGPQPSGWGSSLSASSLEKEIDEFAKSVGREAVENAIVRYREKHEDFDDSWESPMLYASGYTAARLTHAFSMDWIIPLQKRLRNTGLALLFTVLLFACAILYSWSIMDFDTFYRFLAAFVPAIVALLFTLAKSYKTWAEAKKTLAEARQIEATAIDERNRCLPSASKPAPNNFFGKSEI